MSTIVNRATKGSPLTNTEVDSNFSNLNAGKAEKSNNLSDLVSAFDARDNLGLGSAAVSNSTDFDSAGVAVAMAIALGG